MGSSDATTIVVVLMATQILLAAGVAGWLASRPRTPTLPAAAPGTPAPPLPLDALPTGTIVPPVQAAFTSEHVHRGRRGTLTQLGRGRQAVGTYALVAGAPPGLVLRLQNALDRMVDSPAYQERIGDPAFDEAVLVRGDRRALRVLLDADTRARVRAATASGVGIADGVAVWTSPRASEDEARVTAAFDTLNDLLDALELPRERWPARLEAIARTDPFPTIRVDALTHLVELDPPRAEALARALTDDADTTVALAAALRLGAEGLPTVCARLDATTPPATWAAALPALAPLGAAARAPLIRGLGHPDEATVVAVAGALGEVGEREDVEVLAAVTGGRAARDAARAAVLHIQGRLGAVEAGRVSLATENRAGALSTVGDTAGAITVAGRRDVVG